MTENTATEPASKKAKTKEDIDVAFEIPKEVAEFRNYENSVYQDRVSSHYRMMRIGQSVEYVNRMHEKYSFADGKYRSLMSIKDVFKILETYVDSSDPDNGLPNCYHNFQTAEGIRHDGHPEWLQLTGLLHDLGKAMFAIGGVKEDGQHGTSESPQWGLGGDTWVVGCKIPDVVVFPEFNSLSPDYNDSRYNTELGMYEPGCGMDNLKFAYGHDEYMYQMLTANECTLPKEAFAIVRYHSAYPWHNAGAYKIFENDHDREMLPWIRTFNKYDLYTKDEKGLLKTTEELWEHYEPIIAKFFPSEKLKW